MEASEPPKFKIPTAPRRYVLAGLAAVIALMLPEMLSPGFGTTYPYHTVCAAVVFSAWYCGVGPAIFGTVLSLVGVWYFFLPPLHSFRLQDPKNQVTGLVGFGVFSGFIIVIGEINRRSQATLRMSEERLQLAAESSNTGIWDLDFRSGEVYLSPVWKQQIGYADHEIRSNLEEWRSRVHPDDLPQALAKVEALLKNPKASFETELRFRHRDGSYRWIYSSVKAVAQEHGRTTRILGSNFDITGRKEAEAAIRNSDELLELFIEHAPAALAMFDREMRYLRVSRRWRTNYVPDDRSLIGQLHYEVYPVIPEAWKEAHRRGLRGEVVQGDGRFERSDGSVRWVRWEVRPWRNRMDEIGGIVIFSEDITERKNVEAALGESEARLRTALEAARMGTFERDLRTGEAHWMPTTEAMFGFEPGTGPASIEDFLRLIHPEDRDHFDRLMAESTATGVAGGEWRVIWPDGSIHWIYGRWTVFKDEQGQPSRAIGVDYDITARKQAEESLRAQSEQLRALTIRLQQVREEERTMVARDLHDQIGQILTAVKMDVDWTAKHLSPQDEAQLASRLAATLDRLRDATQSLRSICTRLRPGVLDDLGLAAAIEWQVKEFASITGVQCDVSVPQEDFPLRADRSTAIFRILQEALTNVTRHAQATLVRASLAQQNGNVVLVVQDDGKGISKSEVESSRTSLGLLGMKERAEACGGELQIWGDPGKGTTLALQIPLAESEYQRDDDADPAGR